MKLPKTFEKGLAFEIDDLVKIAENLEFLPSNEYVGKTLEMIEKDLNKASSWAALGAVSLLIYADRKGVDAKDVANEIGELIVSKQHDYGKDNILQCPLGPLEGILVRTFDKKSRLLNLLSQKKTPKNESLDDTYKDIVGYCLLALMVIDDYFKLPFHEKR